MDKRIKIVIATLAVLSVLVLSCKTTATQKKSASKKQEVHKKTVFSDLERYLAQSSRSEAAKEFEKIYNQNVKKETFIRDLKAFASTPDRCYWLGVFLWDKEYTSIGNAALASEVLSTGAVKEYSEADKVRFYWQIGYAWFFSGSKDKAKDYLLIADKLSELYPGNRPALSEKDHKRIDRFLAEIKKSLGM